MNKLISIIKFAVGWPLSLLALFFIGKVLLQQLPTLTRSIMHIDFFVLFLGSFSLLFYFLFRSIFWQKVLQYEGIHIPLKDTAWLWAISELKRYIPGSIWSIFDRTRQFEKRGITKKTTARLWLLESEFFVVSCILISLLGINFIISGLLPPFAYKNILIPIIVVFVLLFLYFFLNPHQWNNRTMKQLSKILPMFTLTQNLHLLLTMSLAVIFFGLGTYFSIASFVFLYPADLTSHIGFFAFCFLVGYLAFIVPMGLGVREAVMTYGLSKYLFSIPLAGIGALLARAAFIVTELIFLGLAYLWQKNGNNLKTLEQFVSRHVYSLSLFFATILYSIYFTFASFLRFTNFYTGRFDLGNMDQTVWNTVHGRFFELTNPNGINTISRLAFHADFILVMLAPFYFIWQDPRMLLLIQTLLLACGAFFVYLIAHNILQKKSFALVFAILYLISPSVEYANLYDFHGVVLATTFFLAAWYFLLKKKWIFLIIFLFFAGITKEEVWLVTGMLGIYIVVKQLISGRKLVPLFFGFVISLFSFFAFWFLVTKAIPFANGGQHFALSYYSDFGSSLGGIITTALRSPIKIFSLIIQPGKLLYLLQLFSAVGFVSLLSPLFLLFALPDLSINLLSSNAQLHQIYFQYTAVITPFLFISAIYGVAFIRKHFPTIPARAILLYLLTTGILSAYFFGPLPLAFHPSLDMFMHPLTDSATIDDILATIPRRFSLAATNNIGSHLSHRQLIFTIPEGLTNADVVVFLLNDRFAQPSLTAQRQMAKSLSNNPKYVKLFSEGDFVVFEKKELITIKRVRPKTVFPLFPSNL